MVKRTLSRCPLCGTRLKKYGGKKICPACQVEVVGDTFRIPPPFEPLDPKN